jgi:1,4-alpha-glucan branching enzyme
MGAVRAAIEHRFGEDAFKRVIYTESHDEIANGKARVPEAVWPGNVDSWFSKKRSVLGAALVLTAPGIPLLFQGQELLEDRWFHDKDPIDWSRLEQYGGLVELYKDLIHLRRNWHNNSRGLSGHHVHVYHVNHADKMLAMHRWDQGGPGDSVVVVVNMTHRGHEHYIVGFPRRGLWRVRFNSDWEGYDPSFGNHFTYDTEARPVAWDGLSYSGPIGIGPYSVLILSQDE